jgi:hypothetical protein
VRRGDRADTAAYVALVALTVGGFAASERLGAAAVAPVLGAAALKGALVAGQFMGLRRAHIAWIAACAALVLGTLAGVVIAARASAPA